MEIDLARHVIRGGLRASRELEALLGALKKGCEPDEYDEFRIALAEAIHRIHMATIEQATARYPELQQEIDDNLAKYGRFL